MEVAGKPTNPGKENDTRPRELNFPVIPPPCAAQTLNQVQSTALERGHSIYMYHFSGSPLAHSPDPTLAPQQS